MPTSWDSIKPLKEDVTLRRGVITPVLLYRQFKRQQENYSVHDVKTAKNIFGDSEFKK